MFNVQPGTEISVHAEFSNCKNYTTDWRPCMYSSMAAEKGVRAHFDLPLAESGGQDPTGSPPLVRSEALKSPRSRSQASRGNGERVPAAKVRRSVVNSSPSWAPAEDSFIAAFPASKSTSVGNKIWTHKLLRNYASKICVFSWRGAFFVSFFNF